MNEAVQMGLATSIVALPAMAGLLLLVSRSGDRAARTVGLLASLAASGAVAALMVVGAHDVFDVWEMAPGLFFRVSWRVDFATLCLCALVSGIGTLVFHFSGAYFGATAKGRRAIGTLLIFEASMLGLILSDDLFLLFTFWESHIVCGCTLSSVLCTRYLHSALALCCN